MNDFMQLPERENQRSSFIPDQVAPTQNNVAEDITLSESVNRTVSGYLDAMQGQEVEDLYELVISEIEAPLLESVMKAAGNNQSLTAKMLGLNRGTLRKKLKKYGML